MRSFFPCVVFFLAFLAIAFQGVQAQKWASIFRAGGEHRDKGRQIWVDEAGHQYVSGTYEDKIALGGDTLRSKYGKSAFLACFDANSQVEWVRQAHIKEGEDCLALTGNEQGYLYWAGSFWESVQIGQEELKADNSVEIFLVKLRRNGEVVWAKSVAQTNYLKPWFGGEPELQVALAAHPDGGLYLGSTFRDTARILNLRMTAKGGYDAFLARLNGEGNPVWIQPGIGGEKNEWMSDLSVDSAGNVSVAGRFEKDFALGTFRLRTLSPWSYFLCKFTDQGHLLWADEIGSATRSDHATLAMSRAGEVVLSGGFEGSYFLHKYNSRGHRVWKIRGGDEFAISKIVLGKNGEIFVAGSFSLYLDLGDPKDKVKSLGGRDIFVAKFLPDGELEWLTIGGGEFYDTPSDLFLDGKNALWVVGNVRKEVTFGNLTLEEFGSIDMFWGQLHSP